MSTAISNFWPFDNTITIFSEMLLISYLVLKMVSFTEKKQVKILINKIIFV